MFARNLMLNGLFEDENDDGIPDFLQRPFMAITSSFNYSRFMTNRQSVRGRKELIRDIPIEILQTKHQESDEEIVDENGEDIPVLKDGLFANQDYHKIKSKCLAANQLFTDSMFPPCESSIFNTKQTRPPVIVWKRASELVKNPCFFVDGQSRFDIIQGSLGDCWLSAAVANLTLQTELFEKVVPHDQSFCQPYAGIFHFRFWQFGEWIDVVVDDYLPTKNGQLIYMRSDDPNEFWSALLEKAYAKLHGNYESLDGGNTTDALVDFSGGCTEHFNLNESKFRNPEYVKKLLLRALMKNSMIAASLDKGSVKELKLTNGLVRGHAFSITDVLKLRTKSKDDIYLVRLRNPWGNEVEWNGAWSDKSIEWQMIDETKKNEVQFQDDGEFFMSIEDFSKCFDTLDICNLTPESIEGDDLNIVWQQDHYHGSWTKGESAGGCRNYLDTFVTNPQFNFELMDANNDGWCTCVVALMQKGSRKGKVVGSDCSNGCLQIGFCIYEVDHAKELPLTKEYFRYNASNGGSMTFINRREVVARFNFKHKSGKKYVVVPSTFYPDEEGEFLLRIFSEKKLKK